MVNGIKTPPEPLRVKKVKELASIKNNKSFKKNIQNQENTSQVNETDNLKQAYIQSYGEKLGFEYFQLSQLEDKLANAKKDNLSSKQIADLKKQIGGQKQTISSIQKVSGKKGEPIEKGPGITTTLTKKEGTIIIKKGKVTGFLPAGGYSPVGSSVPSEQFFLQDSNKQSQESLVGGYSKQTPNNNGVTDSSPFIGSSSKGPNVYITKSGGEVEAIASYVKGGVIVQDRPKEKSLTQKQAEKITPSNYTSSIPLFNISEDISKGTNELVKGTGNIIGKGLARQATFTATGLPIFTLIGTKPKKSDEEKFSLLATEGLSYGQYLIPYYGEIKAGSDILTKIKEGKGEEAAIDIGTGLITYGAIKGGSKLIGAGRSYIITKEGAKIEELGLSIKPEESLNVKGFDKGVKILEYSIAGAAGYQVATQFSSNYNQYTSGSPFSQVQNNIVENSSQLSGITIGLVAGQKISAGIRETVLIASGKKFIPYEPIADTKVLSGEKNFPETYGGPKKLLKQFRDPVGPFKTQGGFTATRSSFNKELTVGAGKSETPGIYISPRVSEYFLRLDGQSSASTYSFVPDLLGNAGSPLIVRYEGKVLELPLSVQREYGFPPVRLRKNPLARPIQQIRGNAAFERLPKGNAYVSPQFTFNQKVEAEAIIVPGTILERKDFRYYTKIRGEAVPIQEYSPSRLQKNNTVSISRVRYDVGLSEEYFGRSTYRSNFSYDIGRNYYQGEYFSDYPIMRNTSRIVFSNIVRRTNERGRFSSVARYVNSPIREGEGSSRIRVTVVPRLPDYPVRPSESIVYVSRRKPPIITTRIPREPYYPRPPTRFPPTRIPSDKITQSRSSTLLGQAYGFVYKKKGKEVLAPNRYIRSEVINAAGNFVNRKIAASFRIVQLSGTARRQGIAPTNLKFYSSKRDPRYLVEPRSKRLSTRSEIRDIQSYKRISRRGLF